MNFLSGMKLAFNCKNNMVEMGAIAHLYTTSGLFSVGDRGRGSWPARKYSMWSCISLFCRQNKIKNYKMTKIEMDYIILPPFQILLILYVKTEA